VCGGGYLIKYKVCTCICYRKHMGSLWVSYIHLFRPFTLLSLGYTP